MNVSVNSLFVSKCQPCDGPVTCPGCENWVCLFCGWTVMMLSSRKTNWLFSNCIEMSDERSQWTTEQDAVVKVEESQRFEGFLVFLSDKQLNLRSMCFQTTSDTSLFKLCLSTCVSLGLLCSPSWALMRLLCAAFGKVNEFSDAPADGRGKWQIWFAYYNEAVYYKEDHYCNCFQWS